MIISGLFLFSILCKIEPLQSYILSQSFSGMQTSNFKAYFSHFYLIWHVSTILL